MPLGLGMGLIFAPSMSAATAGVATNDAGVASAMVNTSSRSAAPIGTALLNTLFAAAITSYVATHGGGAAARPRPRSPATAPPSAGPPAIFVAGAVITALILPSGTPAPARRAGRRVRALTSHCSRPLRARRAQHLEAAGPRVPGPHRVGPNMNYVITENQPFRVTYDSLTPM